MRNFVFLLLVGIVIAVYNPKKLNGNIIHKIDPNNFESDVNAGGPGRAKRAVPHAKAMKWTKNTVNYFFDNNLNANDRTNFKKVIELWKSQTCMEFVEDANAQPVSMRISRIPFADNVCGAYSWSWDHNRELDWAGMDIACPTAAVVAHEFGHAMGSAHTQERRDQKHFLTFEYPEWHLAEKSQINDTGVPYEYGSTMHYLFHPSAAKDRRYGFTIGQGTDIAFYDFLLINNFNDCHKKCQGVATPQCENGGYPNPRNCNVCNCPIGYTGTRCTERPTTCGRTVQATSDWQTLSGGVDWFQQLSQRTPMNAVQCVYWIETAPGTELEIEFESIAYNRDGFDGSYGVDIAIEDDVRKFPMRMHPWNGAITWQRMTTKRTRVPVRAIMAVGYDWGVLDRDETGIPPISFTLRYRFVGTPGPVTPPTSPTPSTPTTPSTLPPSIPTTALVPTTTNKDGQITECEYVRHELWFTRCTTLADGNYSTQFDDGLYRAHIRAILGNDVKYRMYEENQGQGSCASGQSSVSTRIRLEFRWNIPQAENRINELFSYYYQLGLFFQNCRVPEAEQDEVERVFCRTIGKIPKGYIQKGNSRELQSYNVRTASSCTTHNPPSNSLTEGSCDLPVVALSFVRCSTSTDGVYSMPFDENLFRAQMHGIFGDKIFYTVQETIADSSSCAYGTQKISTTFTVREKPFAIQDGAFANMLTYYYKSAEVSQNQCRPGMKDSKEMVFCKNIERLPQKVYAGKPYEVIVNNGVYAQKPCPEEPLWES